MGILTTTIGSYPKPDYVAIPDELSDRPGMMQHPTRGYEEALRALGDEAEEIFARGTREAVLDQVAAGVDIPTDGEIRRGNYIHYHCRHIDGIDLQRLTPIDIRGGAYTDVLLPTITGPLSAGDRFLPHDWKVAQSFTDRALKATLPGPMTIEGTLADAYYGDGRRLCADLADALNKEILALAEAGCRYVQVDEPVFARSPDDALDYGIDNLMRCFHGVPDSVTRCVHLCCGYPDGLDSPDFAKAPQESYFQLADAIEDSSIQAVSIEDAHRHNDLALLERFRTTTVILGVVAIASSRVETIEDIAARLEQALAHIDADRLIAAPDCGLGMLGRDLALEKLSNLCAAAHGLTPPATTRPRGSAPPTSRT